MTRRVLISIVSFGFVSGFLLFAGASVTAQSPPPATEAPAAPTEPPVATDVPDVPTAPPVEAEDPTEAPVPGTVDTTDDEDGLSPGLIAALIIGGVVVLLAIFAFAINQNRRPGEPGARDPL